MTCILMYARCYDEEIAMNKISSIEIEEAIENNFKQCSSMKKNGNVFKNQIERKNKEQTMIYFFSILIEPNVEQ